MSALLAAESLAARGLERPALVAERVEAWAQRWGAPPEPWLDHFLASLVKCPDLEMALLSWERWLEALEEPWEIVKPGEINRTLSALFSQSQFLTDILVREPALGKAIADGLFLSRQLRRFDLWKEIEGLFAATPPGERRRALCAWRRRHLLRIGLRDILGRAQVEEHTRELADLAEAVVQAALDESWRDALARWGEPRSEAGEPVSFAVLGMGKLGGRELNFSSDIDLIFVYSAEGETAGPSGGGGRVSVHLFMTKLGERLIDFIGAVGSDGRLYRVDMRLRPEGAVGPIARSLESLEIYFDSQAALWERLAYTKARVIATAGPADFGPRVERVVRRFCYGTPPGPDLPRALADLKHRIDREVARSAGAEGEVKRGSGGIREIEFVIGLFQLIHGHLHEDLRVTGFFEALRALERRQVLTRAAARRLRRAYETLRRIEHRLQMMNEFQTHSLPADSGDLVKLARRLGWSGTEDADIRRLFLADVNQVVSMVHQAFLQHIGAPETTGLDADVASVLDERMPAAQAAPVLERFGLAEAEATVGLLRALGRGGAGSYVDAGAQRTFERLLPALLAWCPQVPSPGLALRQLARFVDAYKARGTLFSLMAEQPQLVEVLMRLFGASEPLGALLARHPEFFDSVVARGLGLAMPAEVLDDLWSQLRPKELTDAKRLLDGLRTLRQMFALALALRQILGLDAWTRFAAQLTSLAEFCLGQAWATIIDQRRETPEPAVCLALGKFGGREINFESDLDVIFVCAPPERLLEPDAAEWSADMTRRCERLVTAATERTRRGFLFDLDARLRPEGRSAPLLCTDRRLLSYFATGAQLWEFQSFLRARPVAGDLALGERIVTGVHRAMRARLRDLDIRGEVRAMRRRLEENADHSGGDGAVDLKRDPGGIIDVEFLVQTLQLEALLAEGTPPEVNTAQALAGLAALDAADRAALRRHLLTLRVMECQLRLLQGGASSSIPADPGRWRQLAIAHLGPRSTADDLRQHMRDVMGPVRAAFDRLLATRPAEPA